MIGGLTDPALGTQGGLVNELFRAADPSPALSA